MSFTIALVGRPNVGKSTLFNRLTGTRNALVADTPGLTRDRQFGLGQLGVGENRQPYYVVDSAGLISQSSGIENLMEQQALQAVNDADFVLFVVDGRDGIHPEDEIIARNIRKHSSKVYLVVNKSEGLDPHSAIADFYQLGFNKIQAISASHNQRLHKLIEDILTVKPLAELEAADTEDAIKVAIIGRPNVGKSTLINRLIGEDRLLAFDRPGTTRDSIEVEFRKNDKDYILIDTAGIRRRGKVKEKIEKFSIIKAMQAVNRSKVSVLVIDANEGFTDQDAGLLGMAIDAGRPLVLAMNKWDGPDSYKKQHIKSELERKLHFIDYLPIHFISALCGTGIRDMFGSVDMVYSSSIKHIATGKLNKALELAVKQHQPPLVHGHRIKLRYAHQGGQNPPRIVIHGNQTAKLPDSYKRYLENFFRSEFNFIGTPLKLEFKSSDNPYKDKKNVLNRRQIAKKKRLKKFSKKKK